MEQLKAFIEKVELNNELKEKIEALGEKAGQPDEVIAIAAEYGINITTEDLKELDKTGELHEDDLDTVTGGSGDPIKNFNCWFTPTGKSVDINGEKWLECSAFCGVPILSTCVCRDKDRCSNKWHKVEPDDYLFPKLWYNHNSKIPPKYNT